MTTASEEAPYFLGIDGGGTGCRARIEDAEGTVLGLDCPGRQRPG